MIRISFEENNIFNCIGAIRPLQGKRRFFCNVNAARKGSKVGRNVKFS